ncbi:hypothetical protein GOP47_0025209 [Adiantum capillus-veneris]|uniref:Pentatricopeptide repeat-containing protein n=1 Tax=Adiantum capillus-veneris TaxID=13818 RepID=A0A9D4Z4C0_ADICA|nr:hypothetical protein GOP47_0025209 [Adiantum capillus-veneris]
MAGSVSQPATVGTLPSSREERESQNNHRRRPIGLLWKEYFRDPSQWCDNRSSRPDQTYPHFQHKGTGDWLWVDGRLNPPWVRDELRKRGLAASIHPQDTHMLPTEEKSPPCKAPARHNETLAFVALLRLCTKSKDLSRGTRIHDHIMKRGLIEKCADALITMYASCGALAKARELLIPHNSNDVITWTTLITSYTRQGQSQNALDCYELMKQEGPSPDAVTFMSVLKACGSIKAAYKGKQIHDEIARQGLLGSDVVLGNALIDMYAKCGVLRKAQQVLEELPYRDVVSWNTLIGGHTQHGQPEQALACFWQMQGDGLSPDAVTFSCILKSCGALRAINEGERIHEQIASQGLLGKNIVLGTALVDMYASCGALVKAQTMLEELFPRDVISWNALISGYAQHGWGKEALKCFERMQHEGISPNSVTFGCILKACGSIRALSKGEQIHDVIKRQGLLETDNGLGTALVDMYAKCGALVKAAQTLEGLSFQHAASWSALIAGYVQEGKGEQAMHCFERMQHNGLYPDAITFTCALKACAIIGAVDRGKHIHDEIVRQNLIGNDRVLGGALVDMYAKCGSLEKARKVLEELPSRDVVSWSALIAGYAQRGESEQVLSCFRQMQLEGFNAEASTFSSVLTSCCHLGLVEEGHRCFVDMSTKYGVKPDVYHYTCMVDLFGRAGHLDKAACLIEESPFSNHFSVLSALLGACRKWGDVCIGRWAFDRVVQVDRSNGAAYVLMSDVYAAAGMQEDAEKIGAMRMENKAW